jgi:hypothetical protein
MKFSDTMSTVIENYVTPLMSSHGLVAKESFIKHMFEDMTKVHVSSLGFLETVRMDMKLYKTEEALAKGIIIIVENMVDEMEVSYAKYASNFAKIVFFSHKYITEIPKFREFVARETLGGQSFFETLCLPFAHFKRVTSFFHDAKFLFESRKLVELALDVQHMEKGFSDALVNAEALVNMALRVQDLPQAVCYGHD